MSMALFFILLILFLAISLPIGGTFTLLSVIPSLLNQNFSFGVSDVARAMFAGLNSFTLLAVPMFMVSGMIMVKGGISQKVI